MKDKKQLVIEKLKELAVKVELMETGPAVKFKKAAYLKAAKAVESLKGDLVSADQLKGIKGVGSKSLEKIQELIDTGGLKKLDKFTNDFSALLKIDGVGPRKAQQLFETYGVKAPLELNKLIKDGLINDEKLARNVKRALLIKNKKYPREKLKEMADEIEFEFRLKCPSAIVQTCGSILRKKRMCKDIDMIFCADPEVVIEGKKVFLGFEWDDITAEGDTRIDAIKNGVAINIRFMAKEEYGSALLYFTGSGRFNERMRSIAKERGFKLSEYGLKDRETGEVIESWSEKEIFHKLGYEFITPEDREEDVNFSKYELSTECT